VKQLLCTLIVASTLFARRAAAEYPDVDPALGCKRNPAIVGDCFRIHGRVQVYNGASNVRIWPVGSTRLLGVLPTEQEIVPDNVRRQLSFSKRVYGNFQVCPFTAERPAHMRFVCVQEAEHLVIEDYTSVSPGARPRITFEPALESVP